MVVAHAQTESGVARKTAVGRDDRDGRWLEGVLQRKSKDAVVLAVLIRCFGGSCDHIVPLEDVFFVGARDDVGRGCCGDGLVLFRQSPLCLSGHHCWEEDTTTTEREGEGEMRREMYEMSKKNETVQRDENSRGRRQE